VIVVRDVSYAYEPGRQVLDSVSLSIGDGELVALIGENGAGKTTLVKHFNGLLKPQRGTVTVDGTDTREATVATLARKVGLVFQNPDHQLFAETVEKELSFALANFGVPAGEASRRVEWALEAFELGEYRNRSPLTLSGGERKRLALASVLCYDPQIIVMDEPTTGQDSRQKSRLASLLTRLNDSGKTVITVTHDMEFVAEFIPRTIIMSRGKVLADGRSADLLVNRAYLESASLLPPQLAEISWELGLAEPSIDLEAVVNAVRGARR